jgi:hypothetical protein
MKNPKETIFERFLLGQGGGCLKLVLNGFKLFKIFVFILVMNVSKILSEEEPSDCFSGR